MTRDLVVLFEHPEWQQPLFAALERRGIEFGAFDLKNGCFDPDAVPDAPLYFNQASPSAYVRGNTRAVPLALSLIRSLEIRGAHVLNGSKAFSLELSKSTQAALMKSLGIAHPRTLAFNDAEVALARWGDRWPALLKPEQGGSGARMYLLYSPDELRVLLRERPEIWLPDNLLLLQEYFEVDASRGIVRMEFLNGELLYAMRVVSHGSFNLCPSEACNPESGASVCEVPATSTPVEFYPYREVPSAAVETGKALIAAGGLDVGGVEYLEANDGRLVFYDINANSNLREPIARSFGFNPFDRVAEFLSSKLSSLAKG
jgi:glutathione synthase/RimK-type ligase-like ATP-grasp enzyme